MPFNQRYINEHNTDGNKANRHLINENAHRIPSRSGKPDPKLPGEPVIRVLWIARPGNFNSSVLFRLNQAR